MNNTIVISGSTNHDGDGLIRPTVTVIGESFSAETRVWCGVLQIAELADKLVDFPKSRASRVQYRLGGPESGLCGLDFFCFDGSGHTAVRTVVTASDSFRSTDYFNRAEICLRVEPAVADFVDALRAFHSVAITEAVLHGMPEYVQP